MKLRNKNCDDSNDSCYCRVIVGLLSYLSTQGTVLNKESEQVLYGNSVFRIVQNPPRGPLCMAVCFGVFIMLLNSKEDSKY